MRYFLFIVSLFMLAQGVFAQSDNTALTQQANTAYASGDYKTAQVLYEQAIQAGFHDPSLYFNLGNAYYESGDLGRALLNYRIVQEYWPRDADLNRNLALVWSERVDLQGDETGLAEGIAALTTGVATFTELSLLVACLWTATFALLALVIFWPKWRRRLRFPLVGMGVVLLVGLLLLGSRFYVEGMRQSGVVVQPVAQVRSGPGDQYLELYQLHSAAEVYVWDSQNGWVRFALPDGRLGWLPVEAVEIVGQ
ncbi:MAG TPA: tetratricopeptide repeat protein [Terriglobales bacterium]|nr:tetratricopeptide repeat protein [Terriglobales bacterium]